MLDVLVDDMGVYLGVFIVEVVCEELVVFGIWDGKYVVGFYIVVIGLI